MDVAITGASGLIGRALAASLEGDGHAVRRIGRPRAESVPGFIAWDPATGTLDAHALDGVDAVVHLAGEGIGDKRWSAEQKRVILDSRTRSTVLLTGTMAAMEAPPRRLLSGSAIGIYGDRGDEVLTETSERGDGFLADVCVAWEAAAEAAIDAGISTAFLRTGIVQTPAGGALAKLLPLFRLGLGGKMGSGRQWWSWITLRDEVAAIRWLLDHDLEGPVNLTAPNPVTNADFAKALGQALGRPSFLPVPAFGPRLLLGRELADGLLFDSARIQPAALLAGGYEFHDPEVTTGLRAALGR